MAVKFSFLAVAFARIRATISLFHKTRFSPIILWKATLKNYHSLFIAKPAKIAKKAILLCGLRSLGGKNITLKENPMRRMFGFLIGIVVGALVGSTVALLLAPESGEQIRGAVPEQPRLRQNRS